MNPASDPFLLHPELRGKITDPFESFFRTFDAFAVAAELPDPSSLLDMLHTDAEREQSRAEAMAGRSESDLWVFAYGSLMWDPAFRFCEVRRGYAPGHARRFILKDLFGARGTREAPGLMAALDEGPGCEGLLFRIAREHVDEETEILWRREKAGPAYIPTFIDVEASDQRVKALTFVADHGVEVIDADITRNEQIHFIATGCGFLGTSLEYLTNIDSQFKALGIVDEEVTSLMRETEAYMKTR
jgi:cation transport protein ChaC